MTILPINYSEKIGNVIRKSKIGFQMINYSETKKVGDEIFGYFNLLKNNNVGGIYVNFNQKEGEIEFGETIINDISFNEKLKLNGLEEKIAKELGFFTIKVEVPEEDLKKEFIKKGYKFKSEKSHKGVKELK